MNFFDLKKLLTKILQNIRRLPNYYSTDGEYNSRPLSANINSDDSGSVINFLATGNMTEGKPTSDGNILHFNWDNNNKWASQLAIPHGEGGVIQHRGQKNGTTWNNWHDVWYDPVEIPANTDLNIYKSPGTRYCPSSGIVATLKNCPTTSAFFLYIEKANRPDTTTSDTYQYYIQTIKDLYGKVYIRYLHNNKGTWTIGAWGNGVPYLGSAATQSVSNSLSTSAAGYVLDARKGKELNDKFASYATASSLNNYFPKSGGTATGNITVNRSNTESYLRAQSSGSPGSDCYLFANPNGNAGIYNAKLGHTLIVEDKNGTVSIHGWNNSSSTQSFSS